MNFLVFLFGFLSIVLGKKETFKLSSDKTSTYVVPIFSPDSKFEDFTNTFNLIISLPDTPDLINVYDSDAFHMYPSNYFNTSKNLTKNY